MGIVNKIKSFLNHDAPLHQAYLDLRQLAEANVETHPSAAIAYVKVATQLAMLTKTSAKHDKRLDAILQSVGVSHIQLHSNANAEGAVVVITSGIKELGGFTQQVVNLVRYAEKQKVVVWSTEVLKANSTDSEMDSYIRQNAAFHQVSAAESWEYQVDEIVRWAAENSIAGFVYYVSANDVVSHMLPSALPNHKHLLVNVSNHHFGLGSFQYDAIIDVADHYHEESIEQKRNPSLHKVYLGGRGLLEDLQGIPKNDMRVRLQIPTDAYLTVTVGNPRKSIWSSDQSYVFIIGEMLMQNTKIHHLLIANGMEEIRELVAYHFPKVRDRIHVLERADDLIPTLKNCDLYLNSFPMGGAMSSLDAIAACLPIVAIPTHKGWYDETNITQVDREEYLEIIHMFVQDFEYRLESADGLQTYYKTHHQPDTVVERILALVKEQGIGNKEYKRQEDFVVMDLKNNVNQARLTQDVLEPLKDIAQDNQTLITQILESV